MKYLKYTILIIVITLIPTCSFFIGLNWNPGGISKPQARKIADIIIEEMTDPDYMNESTVTVKDIYEIKRTLKGFADKTVTSYVDKKSGRFVTHTSNNVERKIPVRE